MLDPLSCLQPMQACAEKKSTFDMQPRRLCMCIKGGANASKDPGVTHVVDSEGEVWGMKEG